MHAGLKVGMVAVTVPLVAVATQMVGIIILLEQAMMGGDPNAFLAQIGLQDRGRQITVVPGRQTVADIVQQRGHHHFRVGAVALRPGRGLK